MVSLNRRGLRRARQGRATRRRADHALSTRINDAGPTH